MTQAPPGHDPTRGLDPRVASVLAYSAWWVTGALFLAVERRDPQVRFHAAQSVVAFAGVSAAIAAAYGAALALMLVSSDAARLALSLANAAWLAGAGLWVWLVYTAARGQRWCVPGLSAVVARLASLPA
jgi:uncharacterized membrane protein